MAFCNDLNACGSIGKNRVPILSSKMLSMLDEYRWSLWITQALRGNVNPRSGY